MEEMLPEDVIHIKTVPYVICNTVPELERAVATLSKLPGSRGVMMRESTSTYSPVGKSTQLADLSANDWLIEIEDCKHIGSNTCPLCDLSNVPTECAIASLSRCPFLKDSVYDTTSADLDIRNWNLLEIGQDS
jgi:hypothetical protein